MRHNCRHTTISLWCVAALLASAGSVQAKGDADSKPSRTIKPSSGFVEDAFAFDAAGTKLAYVNADAAGSAVIRVVDLASGAEVGKVDIGKFTTKPASVEFAPGGAFFVTATDSGRVRGALIRSGGKVARKWGPATDVRSTTYGGNAAVVVHDKRTGKRGTETHIVDVFAAASGRRIGKRATLELDARGRDRKLGFRLEYWADDFTRAVGIKEGVWDRKEDQRAVDFEAWYDLPKRKFQRRGTIKDVLGHRKDLERRKRNNAGAASYVEFSIDRTRLTAGDERSAWNIKLAEAKNHYEPTSLVVRPRPGRPFFTLTIDPVHPEAAAKRRAVTEYVDLYELGGRGTKASRRARILAPERHKIVWRASKRYWVILEKHLGFSRGGKALEIYKL